MNPIKNIIFNLYLIFANYYIFFSDVKKKMTQYSLSYFNFLLNRKPSIENKKDIVLSLMDTIQQYISNEKKRFLLTYENNISLNENIEPLFYQMENYEKMIINSDNVLENIWKKKILTESTPIGNVIMYYNVYKKGFSYYSDVHITYPILNAVAMKYVRIFFCRDLFIDDNITPIENPSPLIVLEQEYEKEKEKKEKEKRNGIQTTEEKEKNKIFKKGPFMKNKSGIQKVNGKEGEKKSAMQEHLYNVNKFNYMGKIANFSFTQKIEKRVIIPSFMKNSFQGLFDSEHNLQQEVFSYRDYKKMAK